MQEYNTIIGNLLSGIKRNQFRYIVQKYNGDKYVKYFNCWSQFVCLLTGQIQKLDSLREIVDSINFQPQNQYHLGIKKNISKSTLAEANEKRDWRIYRDVFYKLIKELPFYQQTASKEIIKILDSSPIKLDLTTHPWAEKTQRIEGIKLHLLYDLTHTTPIYFEFSGARTNDIEVGKKMEITKNSTYVFDKGYMDFNWWYKIDKSGAFFVTRLKKNNAIEELSEIQSCNETISSQLIKLKRKHLTHSGQNHYANTVLKRVFVRREGKSPLVLVTNDLNRSSEEIAELYKQRWQIELFFKWIKQNLEIKKFLGRSENAVKTQICIALISVILLEMAENLRKIFAKIPAKNILMLIGNNLFSTLKPRRYGRTRFKDPNQLQFEFIF